MTAEERIKEALRSAFEKMFNERLEGMRDAVWGAQASIEALGALASPIEKARCDLVAELLDQIDHQAARIAALASDSDQWQDGKRAGWACAIEAAASLLDAHRDNLLAIVNTGEAIHQEQREWAKDGAAHFDGAARKVRAIRPPES